ncbi:MAG TPA: ABC transporter permease, partial [Vicinamibacterales bacterium]|nr:ABC transporter permease [Vicinamibacterales bacterium]
MSAFLPDFRQAFRTLRKSPGFALTASLALALGIGASTAIFSVVNAVLLRPLPYADSERLVHIWQDMRNRNVRDFPWPPADFADLRERGTLFEGVAALTTGRQVVTGDAGQVEAEVIRTGGTTPNLFRVLGARMRLGRDFTDEEGLPPVQPLAGQAAPGTQQPPPPPIAVLSYEFWQRRFGGDAAVVGTVVSVGRLRYDVIGVLEPGFEILFPPGTNIERNVDVWTPLRMDFAAGSRINVFLRVVGRLKPGVALAQSQEQMDALAAYFRKLVPIKDTA